ncbi:hypothetical protein Tco_0655473 [Tanacetum coccineum]|uniref:Uncharacterized protein n=1 Tax=Tanacetum coccineum TaxID=301880 RepID=A0ABQ4X640_9ASTR
MCKGIIMSVEGYLNSFHLFICVLPFHFPSINSVVTPFSPLIEVKDSTTQSLDFLFLLSTTNGFGSGKASFIGGLWWSSYLDMKDLLDTGNTDKNSSFYDESIISESTSRNASMEAVSPFVFQSHVPRRSMSLQLRVNKPPLPNNTRVKPLVLGTQIDVPPRSKRVLMFPKENTVDRLSMDPVPYSWSRYA